MIKTVFTFRENLNFVIIKSGHSLHRECPEAVYFKGISTVRLNVIIAQAMYVIKPTEMHAKGVMPYTAKAVITYCLRQITYQACQLG